MKVMIATDGSEQANKAFTFALSLLDPKADEVLVFTASLEGSESKQEKMDKLLAQAEAQCLSKKVESLPCVF